jgi:enoyl-CoA hydratase/carnithine racemase
MAKKEYPLEKPKLEYAHEVKGSIKAEEITERIPPFSTTDADLRPEVDPGTWLLPEEATFEEYSKILSPVFQMKKKNGIIEARAHTAGGSLVWGFTAHAYMHKLFEYVNADRDAEVLIFGGTGDNFFESLGPHDAYRDTSRPLNLVPDTHPDYDWQLYEHQYFDGTNDIETEINISIPTIGVWNGGSFHSDLYLLTDITLATEDAWTTEQHFRLNMVPGDGVQIAWRNLMGWKRFAYAELTGEIITARKALEWGMVNEIHTDTEACYARAWEIADLIMHSGTRQTRRLTVQALRYPWKEAIAKELRGSFATEMWNTRTEASPHDPLYWESAKAEAKANLDAEKKGKVIRPRIGPFVEEDPIK